jgi:tetratricopeptide (TPR) repeat protein
MVVAMDSPSARRPGEFNWGSTLWHEMSHVFILTATNFRVPRWFTEGLAVHEEGKHSPEWKNQPTPEVLAAIRDKKLLPVARLDRGFVYPDYPAQVMVSYFQAGSICDFVEEKWGEGKLLDMVHSYAQLKTTPEAIQQNLAVAPEEFDKRYLAWIDHRYGGEAAHFDMWREKVKGLVAAAKQNQYDGVLRDGPAVVAMYPEYVGEASAYELIATAAKAQGNGKTESEILSAYVHQGGQRPELLKRLATLEDASGQHAESAATLERLNYVYPVKDEELHQRLGDLLYAQKQFDGAVREYNAVVASHPGDKAGAEFKLAQAYFAAGQKDKAQESVLAALETAPGYRPAQKLLLQLQETSPKTN